MARRRLFDKNNKDEVVVAQNEDGEATHGTTQEGNESPVENTESIPQNPDEDIETTEPTNPVAEQADEDRTDEEKEFSNESNPNQKARTASTEDAEVDQDGNPRTGGYSYGVAPDDTDGTVPEPANEPEDEDEQEDEATPLVYSEDAHPRDFLNSDVNAGEWSVEKQQKLEKQLSDPKNGILARVTTSAGDYVRVKFFRNNKPLATYRSRDFKASEAKDFLKKVRDERGL